MNYRKYIYRRLDNIFDKVREHFRLTGEELHKGFAAALKEHDSLLVRVEKLYSDARKGKYDIANTPRWSEAVHAAETLRREAVKIVHDNLRSYCGKQYVNIDVLVGYCPQTIPYYKKMIVELKNTFPEAETRDIRLGQVSKSHCVQGFTLISWGGEIEFKEADCEKGKLILPSSRKGGKDFSISENCDYCS